MKTQPSVIFQTETGQRFHSVQKQGYEGKLMVLYMGYSWPVFSFL